MRGLPRSILDWRVANEVIQKKSNINEWVKRELGVMSVENASRQCKFFWGDGSFA